jgi:hypothetical protein
LRRGKSIGGNNLSRDITDNDGGIIPFRMDIMVSAYASRKISGRKEEPRDNNAPYFQQETSDFFTELVNNPPSEYIFGLVVPEDIGRVWKKSSELDFRPSNAQEFLAFTNPAHLKVACNFLIVDGGEPGYVKIRSEFRTGALSMTARKKFSVYWRIISPFSHYIQKQWVKAIKRRAEQS